MNLDLEKIDANFKVETAVGEKDVVFYDVKNAPFDLYGFYSPHTEQGFKRLPDEIGLSVNEGVSVLYLNSAGGRVRFCTDSQYIAIRAEMSRVYYRPHMTLISSAGFDLYIDSPESCGSRFYDVFKPSIGIENGFESKVVFNDRKLRYITINFPSYSSVTSLKIGISNGSILGSGLKYRDSMPIVYYGSSITQGACSSRPGNAFPNIISRRTNTDFINLGFSGSAKGEESISRYMADLPMSIFVCDYDHNSPNAAELERTHLQMYKIIRKKNPSVPYIMISKPDFNKRYYQDSVNRRNAVYNVYHEAISEGDKNVYFIDGSGIFRNINEDMCTVDTTHPNDYGFYLMAEAIESELRWIWSRAGI